MVNNTQSNLSHEEAAVSYDPVAEVKESGEAVFLVNNVNYTDLSEPLTIKCAWETQPGQTQDANG